MHSTPPLSTAVATGGLNGPFHLILNPAAGPLRRRGQAEQLVKSVTARLGSPVTHHTTEGPDHARLLAQQAVAAGANTVLVGGGDGTINEALQGLAGSGTCLAPLPLGTANVLCSELQLPHHVTACLEQLVTRRPQPVSVGLAQWPGGQRHFLLMVGVGLDGAIVADVQSGPKGLLGEGAYFLQGMATAVRYRYPTLCLSDGHQQWHGNSVVIANARNYAGKFVLAPAGGLQRDDLCMVLFEGRSPWAFLRYGLGVLSGRHVRQRGVTIQHGKCFSIDRLPTGGPPVPGHVDGEIINGTPLNVTIQPASIQLPLPPTG